MSQGEKLDQASGTSRFLNGRDSVKPHTLSELEVDWLKQQVAAYSQIKAAYLVEKVITYFPEKRFCILGVVRQRSLIEREGEDQKLLNLLVKNLQFSTQAYIIILNHNSYSKLKQKIYKIDRSLIFKR
jgi:hypothetical protein